MKKVVIATHNKHKIEEFKRIVEPMGISLITADLPEVEETGSTFKENALIKAKSAFMVTGLPSVADDSGLEVDALNGEPGVYSARYAGIDGDDKANNKKLLKNLENVKEEDRTARFVCTIAYVDENISFTVRGTCEGKIAYKESGANGFGYDPLFITEKGCFGELSGEDKDSVSHRGNALIKFKEKLEELKLC